MLSTNLHTAAFVSVVSFRRSQFFPTLLKSQPFMALVLDAMFLLTPNQSSEYMAHHRLRHQPCRVPDLPSLSRPSIGELSGATPRPFLLFILALDDPEHLIRCWCVQSSARQEAVVSRSRGHQHRDGEREAESASRGVKDGIGLQYLPPVC